jgi:hypothetical protein
VPLTPAAPTQAVIRHQYRQPGGKPTPGITDTSGKPATGINNTNCNSGKI